MMNKQNFRSFGQWKSDVLASKAENRNYYEKRSTEEIMKELQGGEN